MITLGVLTPTRGFTREIGIIEGLAVPVRYPASTSPLRRLGVKTGQKRDQRWWYGPNLFVIQSLLSTVFGTNGQIAVDKKRHLSVVSWDISFDVF